LDRHKKVPRPSRYQFPYEIAHKIEEASKFKFWNGQEWVERKKGEPYWISLQAARIGDPDLSRALLVIARHFGIRVSVHMMPSSFSSVRR